MKDIGSGVIGGVECDHLAFRAKEVDWQIWIAQGERVYPCRYTITSKLLNGGPQYSIQVRAWKSGARSQRPISVSRTRPMRRRWISRISTRATICPHISRLEKPNEYDEAICRLSGCRGPRDFRC
ncbi:MAG: DUF2092 domain-containing protein [Sedimenticolaceae bacterium]